MGKQVFALYFANRGNFPKSIIASSKKTLTAALDRYDYSYIMPPEETTVNGAFTTAAEGNQYAAWLKQNEGKYDGVILSLINFGDENGVMAAICEVKTPILIHAFPDLDGKMDPANRRDSFCGKISVMNTLRQCGVRFTVFAPHTVMPDDIRFKKNIDDFAAVCRIYKGMRKFTVGMIGARVTPFKTVRFDEITLQHLGISVETHDLSELFARIREIDENDLRVIEKNKRLQVYSDCSCVNKKSMTQLCLFSVAIDEMIDEYGFDCIGLRCWPEIEKTLSIAPCVILSELNDRMIEACCETDVCNAVIMRALRLASENPSACLDWNNNYRNEDDKCILFHCGPTAQSLMQVKGKTTNHVLLASPGNFCYGSNEGRLKSGAITYSSAITENGSLNVYIGEGRITADKIEDDFFGSAGVIEIKALQEKLISIGRNGFRHHMVLTPGSYEIPLREAFEHYLGYKIIEI